MKHAIVCMLVLGLFVGCAGSGGGSGGMGGQGLVITITQGGAEDVTKLSEAPAQAGKAIGKAKGGNVSVINIYIDDEGTALGNPSQPSEERATQEPTTKPSPSATQPVP